MHTNTSVKKAEDQAIAWLARLNASDLNERDEQAFMDWLAASPVNQAAYIKAEYLWQQGAVLAEVSEDAQSRSGFGDFFHFNGWQLSAAFSFVAVLVVLGLLLNPFKTNEQYFETAVGEQQQIKLEDGSELILNTESQVEVRFQKGQRTVRLIQGEAFFGVQADPDRPFIVITEAGAVRVVGTRFAVQQKNGDAVVTVIEGKVALFENQTPANKTQSGKLLQANERITMSDAKAGREAAKVDANTSLAWRNKQLIFREHTLAELVEELDRYFPENLVLAESDIASKQVTAVIKLDDLDKSLQSLELSLNLRITRDDHNNIVFSQN